MANTTIDVAEAKRLDALEKSLIAKFREAEKAEQKVRNSKTAAAPVTLVAVDSVDPISTTAQSSTLPPPPPPPQPRSKSQNEGIAVAKAKQLAQMQTRLRQEFADVHTQEVEAQREQEKKYAAITRAINEKRERSEEAEQKNKEQSRRERYNQLMKRFRPSVSSTPENRRVGYVGDMRSDDEDDRMEIEEVPARVAVANQSIKQLVDSRVVNLGAVGTRYLPKSNDQQFGIYYDETTERLKIGDEPISFDYDDILVKGKRYKGTEGLWKLLTTKGFVQDSFYTSEDWRNYKELLLTTHSLYQKNDPRMRRPKSSQNSKWKRLIKPIWDEHLKAAPPPPPPTSQPRLLEEMQQDVEEAEDEEEDMENAHLPVGSGLKEYHGDRPVEYRYIKNLHELVNRLNFIQAEEAAGNNNFNNEKLSMVKFVYDRMEELVRRPNGIKYLVRCLSALPEHVIEGSGIVNDIINKLPFELHMPRDWSLNTYNFCGPGTKLDKRLARGDKGVNPLDEACKQHDVWYRDHQKTEDRWVADKALQKAAWNRVTAPDADTNERVMGLATTGAMWLKRKLGMGLGTSSCEF